MNNRKPTYQNGNQINRHLTNTKECVYTYHQERNCIELKERHERSYTRWRSFLFPGGTMKTKVLAARFNPTQVDKVDRLMKEMGCTRRGDVLKALIDSAVLYAGVPSRSESNGKSSHASNESAHAVL